MKAGFIGAGKVGFSLGKYLVSNGVAVTGYYSKSLKSAEEAADFTKTKTYNSIASILKDSDTIFVTVPDGIIKKYGIICEIWMLKIKIFVIAAARCHRPFFLMLRN